MRTLIRSTVVAAAALVMAVGPVAAMNCAPYVSGWYWGGPAAGYLLGQKKITVSAGWDWYVGYTYSEELCVGVYRITLRDGSETTLQLRCDNYTVWGMF